LLADDPGETIDVHVSREGGLIVDQHERIGPVTPLGLLHDVRELIPCLW
jgi:hypothetical protein